jgi:hypothetical protein
MLIGVRLERNIIYGGRNMEGIITRMILMLRIRGRK